MPQLYSLKLATLHIFRCRLEVQMFHLHQHIMMISDHIDASTIRSILEFVSTFSSLVPVLEVQICAGVGKNRQDQT